MSKVSGNYSADQRQPTKKKRADAFRSEIVEILVRVAGLESAIRKEDVAQINHWYDLLGVSVLYLNANDPRQENNQ